MAFRNESSLPPVSFLGFFFPPVLVSLMRFFLVVFEGSNLDRTYEGKILATVFLFS